jgi:hypothetical protein
MLAREQIGDVRRLRRRFIETNGIRMPVAEQGEGPLMLPAHRFPGLWYSRRHRLSALAVAGFHAAASESFQISL